MAKTTPAARKARSAKPAANKASAAKSETQTEAAPETGAAAAQPFQGAGGAEAKPEGAAASSGGAEAKAADGEEKQPEETARPPVAGPEDALLIVTGPKKGRWRAGLHFGSESRAFSRDAFDLATDQGRQRFLAVVGDPVLRCVFRLPDGSEQPVDKAVIDHALAALAEAQ